MSDKDFETSDLYFAAYLKAAKIPWKGCFPDTREDRKGRMKFTFEGSPEIRELQHAYFSRSAQGKIVPLNYADEIKALKAMTRV
jgi:hypothetical protein